jgi:hypothetical protein
VLAGTLSINQLANFIPQQGESFEILDASSVTGEFTSITGDYLGNGLFFDVVYDADGVTLQTTRAGLGDTDLDGDVDLNDLGNLASRFGQNDLNIDWMNGDFDNDNDVDLNDLGAMASNFDAGRAQAYAEFQALVPEPTALSFVPVGLLFLKRIRASSSRHPLDHHRTGSAGI